MLKNKSVDAHFKSIATRYGDYALRFVRKKFKGKIKDDQDLVHDTLLKLAEYMAKNPGKVRNVKSYLFGMLQNAGYALLGEKIDIVSLEEYHYNKPETSDPRLRELAEALGLPENAGRLDICLEMVKRLGEPCKTILTLYLKGKSHQEIAEITGKTKDTVKTNKSDCIRKHLKSLISKL